MKSHWTISNSSLLPVTGKGEGWLHTLLCAVCHHEFCCVIAVVLTLDMTLNLHTRQIKLDNDNCVCTSTLNAKSLKTGHRDVGQALLKSVTFGFWLPC